MFDFRRAQSDSLFLRAHARSSLFSAELSDAECSRLGTGGNSQVGEVLRKSQIDSPNENVYQEDAFARYLSALMFEAAGELDSAFVDYKLAVKADDGYWSDYGVGRPASLLLNAERVARRLGDWAEADRRALGGVGRSQYLPEGAGEVFVLHYNGLSPMKDQIRFTIPFSRALFLGTGR